MTEVVFEKQQSAADVERREGQNDTNSMSLMCNLQEGTIHLYDEKFIQGLGGHKR